MTMRKVDGEWVDDRTYTGLVAIFTRVAEHLLRQARRAVCHSHTGGLRCAYRLIDGRACAVGCLISTERYRDELERRNPEDPQVVAAVTLSLGRQLTRPDVGLLLALQHVHDLELAAWGDDSGIPAWAIVGPLNRVAEQFNLPLLPRPASTPAGV